ncbi:glycosyltransferase family 2 protein [Microbacterium sp. KUDC0406]|uniref:glycosyltransferase family 2 protein n=1 Tax=Microbacterium sp. KUDC0406 TaxID=2909588 RepID=UPI001F43923B|nr:glycosyltransferase family 2 protein [Microbacterium sp. KUDC0406]UJP08879.1 glycosyltransferase family 2 protein [Microbacterium sp. KUDC0406]
MTEFTGPDGPVDLAVVVVTYRSADDVLGLIASLRADAGDLRVRVVVADNSPTDETRRAVAQHPDVICVATGGNLGYAGGINAAMAHVGEADAIVVLNPDLVVEPGCLAALRARQLQSGAGIIVPRIMDDEGLTPSLRWEPSLLRMLGDALFGGRLRGRPQRLSEIVFSPAAYRTAHTADWATGAALLIDAETAAMAGPWDERFFLYSEETDFFRRVRENGGTVWFEPTATVHHRQGGSGSSIDLDRLLAVNRIRYARKHHPRGVAACYRGMVVLHELLRIASPRHRAILGTVLSERSWAGLPRAQRYATR